MKNLPEAFAIAIIIFGTVILALYVGYKIGDFNTPHCSKVNDYTYTCPR